MTNQEKIIQRVVDERKRQNQKWGFPQKLSLIEWQSILSEEVGEVAKEINDISFSRVDRVEELKEELIQVAAVAISMVEHIERKERLANFITEFIINSFDCKNIKITMGDLF
jgi:NTP pyrophosphatase (non-canonical NTP hydrolase)